MYSLILRGSSSSNERDGVPKQGGVSPVPLKPAHNSALSTAKKQKPAGMEVRGGWNIDAGVVLVAVDVSNEISSHAVEWAVQKAVRPNDRLILLAFFRPFLPPKSSPLSLSIFKLRSLSVAEHGCYSLSLSGINCNIVLANHANPKTLKFINPMPTSTPIEEDDDEHKGVEEAHHNNRCHHSIKRTPTSTGISTPEQERFTLSYHPFVYHNESKVAQNFSNKGLARTKAIATTTEVKGRRSLDSLSKRSKHRINISSSPVRIRNREQEDRVDQNSHLIVQQKESEVTQEMSTNNHGRIKMTTNAAQLQRRGRRSLDSLSKRNKQRINSSSTSTYFVTSTTHPKEKTLLSSYLLLNQEELKNTPKLPRNYPANKNTSTSATRARGRGQLVPLSRPSKHSISISSSSDSTRTTDQEESITPRSHPIVHKNESMVTPEIPTKNLASTKTNNAKRAKGKRPSGSFPQRSKSKPDACATILEKTSSLRRAMPITVKQLPPPPPLCSVCKHRAPEHSKPPRRFSREEVEEATNGYIDANFLGEGGFGSVYRGVLKDGQVVAVKRHRAAGLQGATEFCTEVEVLSCVQHRNLVKLLGYCVEQEWLLIYEYACNGSLDKQLHGNSGHEVIEWKHRQKVAIGSARGLRYLHEDCRVGCIIHRDFRPKNILLTHDFEPMVGDFGLARWQIKDQSAEETRIIGALGYLAPEYLETGKITEKTDVYAYGVMLMELITGVKALELNKREWQKHLHKLVNSPLENAFGHELIDSRLEGKYDVREAEYMTHIAALCISTDPDMRPCMSKVLRMLEDVP